MTLGALVGGVLAGIAAILAWNLPRYVGHWRRNRRLCGPYEIKRKLADVPLHTASIKMAGRALAFEYESVGDGRSVVGKFAMDERLPQSGEGYYSDTSPEKQLWGFLKLQIKDRDTLLVHTMYANHETYELVTSGFVWSRIKPSDTDSGL